MTLNVFAVGNLDTTFNNPNGYRISTLPSQKTAGVDLQKTGALQDHIIVASYNVNASGFPLLTFRVRRFHPNSGMLTTSGWFTFPAAHLQAQATAMTVYGLNDQIFVAGQTNLGCVVVRFSANLTTPSMVVLPNPPGTIPSRCLASSIEINQNRLYIAGTTVSSIGNMAVTTVWRLFPTTLTTDGAWNFGNPKRTQLTTGSTNTSSNGVALAFTGSTVWVTSSVAETTHPVVVEGYNSSGVLLTNFGNVSTDISTTGAGIHRINILNPSSWINKALIPGDSIANGAYIWVGGGVVNPNPAGIDYRLVRIPINGATNYVYPDVNICRSESIKKLEFNLFSDQLVAAGPSDGNMSGNTTDLTAAKYRMSGTNPFLHGTWAWPSGNVLPIPAPTTPPCPGIGDRRRLTANNGTMRFSGMAVQRFGANANKIIMVGLDGIVLRIARMTP